VIEVWPHHFAFISKLGDGRQNSRRLALGERANAIYL